MMNLAILGINVVLLSLCIVSFILVQEAEHIYYREMLMIKNK